MTAAQPAAVVPQRALTDHSGAAIAHGETRPAFTPNSDNYLDKRQHLETSAHLHLHLTQDQHQLPRQPQNAVCDVLNHTDTANDTSLLPVPRGTQRSTAAVSVSSTTSTTSTTTISTDRPNAVPVPVSVSVPNIPIPLDTPGLRRSTTNTTIRSASSASTTANPSHNNSSAYTHTPGPAKAHLHEHHRHHHHHHPPPPPPPPSAVRKPSPGLAARLKALGFGTSQQSTSPATPQVDHIGRLDEQQLRQLDEKHQANSISSIISRRGRPWKGAGASTSALVNSTAALSVVAAESPQLPAVCSPEPLAMDTQKYRLPDHTNGNGTKVTLDIRREHIERFTRPASPLEATPPPPPPPKDTPPLATPATPISLTSPNDYVPGLSSYFTPGHNRPGSIYTLSRASFANQLAQLTSLQLPDADSLSSKVSAIRTAQAATKALINASEQIRSWIAKAQEVIGGLDSEDDVEWAAAGGREGLEEVENAITRFEDLINAYISAIEELQQRADIPHVPSDDLKLAVSQMESIVDEWAHIRATLTSVRVQVEIAMEWEELWNNVLGDIQGEMDELSRLVFEMEERRHKTAVASSGGDVDIGDLETIVEDTPPAGARLQASNRFTLAGMPMSPGTPGTPGLSQDDSSLLALFARMQPLRASLDFLPMRLSVFEARAEKSFPTACEELEMRRNGLDASYKKLEKDAESLRKELGEDRWVIVFRGAGRQAQKMHESVQRSLLKLSEAVDTEVHMQVPPTMMKKMESYEAKKTHYGPAIERVLSIIDRGVKDRLTVNGEILRLHHDMQTRWKSLKVQMHEMDAIIDDIQADRKSQQLRDSVSSMLSNDRSTVGSGRDTPGSSPPSSVIMTSLGFDPHTPLPKGKGRSPNGNANKASQPVGRRHSSLPGPAALSTRTAGLRLSTIANLSTATLAANAKSSARPGSILGNRPVWNGSVNISDLDTGHHFKPLSLTTPSPYSKTTPKSQRSVSASTPSSASRLPTIRNTISRAASESPHVEDTPSRVGHSRLSFRERLTSPGPYSQQTLSKSRLMTKSSMSALSSKRRVSMQPTGSDIGPEENRAPRPASSLAFTHRRTSLLPQLKGKPEGSTGRASPQLSSSRLGNHKPAPESKDSKPKWRH